MCIHSVVTLTALRRKGLGRHAMALPVACGQSPLEALGDRLWLLQEHSLHPIRVQALRQMSSQDLVGLEVRHDRLPMPGRADPADEVFSCTVTISSLLLTR